MKTPLLKMALAISFLTSVAFSQNAFFFRVESDSPSRITDVESNGWLTWSNITTPSYFYLDGTLSLQSTNTWYRVVYGETTNRITSVQAPLKNPLVLFGMFPHSTNLWLGRPLDGWRTQIKSSGNYVRYVSISKDARHALYLEANTPDTEDDFAVKAYDVPTDTTTTLVAHAGRTVAFDENDDNYFFYIGNPPTGIFRRTLDGSTNTLWIQDAGREIDWFNQSRNGRRILIISYDQGSPYHHRFVTYTGQGVFERVLLEASLDCYNCWLSPDGNQAVVSYRENNCSGAPHVIVYNLNTGAGQELSAITTNGWPSSSETLFLVWTANDELLSLQTNLFFSPVDGHITGNWSVPAGYDVFGCDEDWQWYVTDSSLTHILRLEKNP